MGLDIKNLNNKIKEKGLGSDVSALELQLKKDELSLQAAQDKLNTLEGKFPTWQPQKNNKRGNPLLL